MLNLTDRAQAHFRKLVEQQAIPGLGVFMQTIQPGTPNADCRLQFCESGDLVGDEWALECSGFTLYVEAQSIAYLEGAEIDYQSDPTGGRLTVRAPKLKGMPPGKDASLAERVRYLIDTEINPQIAAHRGHVSLVDRRAGQRRGCCNSAAAATVAVWRT